jgi:hypothetical protein
VAVTLDLLAVRYGKLPSEILSQGSTLDLQIFDIARSYEKMRENKVNGVMPEVKEEILLEVLNKVRNDINS